MFTFRSFTSLESARQRSMGCMAVLANDLMAARDELGTVGKVTRNTLQATEMTFCTSAIHRARMRGREGTEAALAFVHLSRCEKQTLSEIDSSATY